MPGKLSLQSTIELSSGTKASRSLIWLDFLTAIVLPIPCIGLGVYQSPPEVTVATVKTAIQAGYRHIDSAHWYFNEAQVGQAAIADPSVPRSAVFLTTKLGHPDKVAERLRESVSLIDPSAGGYVDLFLIHAPWAGPEGRKMQWGELEKLVGEGKAKAIGVSNFGVRHLEEMEAYAKIPPAVNQIELHPWCQQPAIVSYCRSHNITLEAYSPLVQGTKAQDPVLQRIASETGKSWAQVLIRWSLQQGFIPLPKSDTPGRIVSNTEVFDFELSDEQMGALNALDADEHVCLNPTDCP